MYEFLDISFELIIMKMDLSESVRCMRASPNSVSYTEVSTRLSGNAPVALRALEVVAMKIAL